MNEGSNLLQSLISCSENEHLRVEPVVCSTIDENDALLQEVPEQVRSGKLGKILLLSNIKLFAEKLDCLYKSKIRESLLGWNGHVSLLLSKEDPDSFKHDFVGFLKLLDIYFRKIEDLKRIMSDEDVSSESSEMRALGSRLLRELEENLTFFILDGGQKTRNYLLTLYFGYQGMFKVLNETAHAISVYSCCAVASQFPSRNSFVLLCASDTSFVLERLTIGEKSIAYNLPEIADVVLLAMPFLSQSAIVDKLALLRNLATDDLFSTISNIMSLSSNSHLDAKEIVKLIDDLKMATSKGMMVADPKSGEIIRFIEKPTPLQLLDLVQEGTVYCNVMYSALRKRCLSALFSTFDEIISKTFEPKKLREAIPFGFYATLCGSVTMSEEDHRKEWDRSFPSSRIPDTCQNRRFWATDGESLRSASLKFRSRHPFYVASMGGRANVRDFGEPNSFVSALRDIAFSSKLGQSMRLSSSSNRWILNRDSRISSSLCLDIALQGNSSSSSSSSSVIISQSRIEGEGKLQFRGNADLRFIISNCFIHLPRNTKMILGDGGVDGKGGRDTIILESCNLNYRNVNNNDVVVVSIGSKHGSSILLGATEAFPLISEGGEMLVSLYLLDGKGHSKTENTRFSLFKSVKEVANVEKKQNYLEIPSFLEGRNYYQTLRSLDSAGMCKTANKLRKDIDIGNEYWKEGESESESEERLAGKSEDIPLSLLELAILPQNKTGHIVSNNKRRSGGSGGSGISKFESQSALISRLLKVFSNYFAGSRPQSVVIAPGRINFGSAHTDWTYMTVIGCPLDRYVCMGARILGEKPLCCLDRIEIVSHGMDAKELEVTVQARGDGKFEGFLPSSRHSWSNYILGVVNAFAVKEDEFHSISVPSWKKKRKSVLQIAIVTSLPASRGLSSSAALENCISGLLTHFCSFEELSLSEKKSRKNIEIGNPPCELKELEIPFDVRLSIARLGNDVEKDFVGVSCGILDQLTSILSSSFSSSSDTVMYGIDCLSNDEGAEVKATLSLPLSKFGYRFVLMDSCAVRDLQQFSSSLSHRNHFNPFEKSLGSLFNSRVFRYWCGVQLLIPKEMKKGASDPSRLQSYISIDDIRDLRKVVPKNAIVFKFPEGEDDVEMIDRVFSELGIREIREDIRRKSSRRSIAGKCAVLAEAIRNANANAENTFEAAKRSNERQSILIALLDTSMSISCSAIHYVGVLKHFPREKQNSFLLHHLLRRTALWLDMMEYMVTEDMRMKAVIDLWSNWSKFHSENCDFVRRWRFVKEDCFGAIPDIVARGWHRDFPFRALEFLSVSSVPLAKLHSLDERSKLLLSGLIGIASWRSKRDLFRGDDPSLGNPLQTAYDKIWKMYPDCMGIFAPGAGWGGLIGAIVSDRYVCLGEDGDGERSGDVMEVGPSEGYRLWKLG